jgi:hypothetical protein
MGPGRGGGVRVVRGREAHNVKLARPRTRPLPLTAHPDPATGPAPGFGRHYFSQCPQLFASDDAAYILAYAIIMLNTDLHNSQVKGAGMPASIAP